MKFKGIEIGSLADWFSGVMTALGIYIAVWQTRNQNKVKWDFGAFVDKQTGVLKVSFVNKNNFDVEVQAYGYYIYKGRMSKKIENKDFKYFKDVVKVIKSNQIDVYKMAYPNAFVIFGETNKYLRIRPLILDSTGTWKVSKKKYLIKQIDLNKATMPF